jgi:para-nitrobenzyl esterase
MRRSLALVLPCLLASIVGCDDGDPPIDDAGPPDAGPPLPADQVLVSDGLLQGAVNGAVRSFLGIPYAAPPTEQLRFRPPVPPAPWSSEEARDATAFGPRCLQRERRGEALIGDEDCLTLNVWAPVGGRELPVMVWIHGGGFVQGGADLGIYDGAALAEAGEVVVVSIQYRIGALGFLATPELEEEAAAATGRAASVGNYGILDQIAALEWVRDEIAAFGGDPSRVTIFGESAGGSSVCVHLGAAESAGLFAGAVIQSGGGCGAYPDLEEARSSGTELVALTVCSEQLNQLACLRTLDAETLVGAQYDIGTSSLGLPDLGPSIDGQLLTGQPVALLAAGMGNPVPTITGSNADEADTFTVGTRVLDRASFETLVRSFVFDMSREDDVIALYPESTFPVAKDAYNAFFSDVAFICPTLRFAEATADRMSVFVYHFTHTLGGTAEIFGSIHGLEIPFVFDTLGAYAEAYTPNTDDAATAAAMQGAWIAFAQTGAPDLEGWTASTSSVGIFDDGGTVAATIREGRCEVLADVFGR